MLSKVSKNRADELEVELKSLFNKAKENKLVEGIINSKIKLDI